MSYSSDFFKSGLYFKFPPLTILISLGLIIFSLLIISLGLIIFSLLIISLGLIIFSLLSFFFCFSFFSTFFLVVSLPYIKYSGFIHKEKLNIASLLDFKPIYLRIADTKIINVDKIKEEKILVRVFEIKQSVEFS